MSALNQQTLDDSEANERPPMLEKGNYIPWESRFRRFLDNKLEEGERMWRSIEKGPYVRPMIPDPDDTREQIIEPLSKMTEINKKQYIADVRVMNYLLQAIPNDIYNSADACKTAQEMWERFKRLMYGYDVTKQVRHSQLMDEFDKFAAKERESLEYVYERLTTLVNIMDCNNVHPILVSINTKFLNCLQPEWSNYVTMVCHNQIGDTFSYDQLYDSLVQFEPHVQASKAKRAARNHDPLALIAHSNASSSQSHANYQGELQGDSQEDKLTTAMMLLAQEITQKFSTPTNNRLRTSSNTRNQVVIQDGRVAIETKNAGYGGNGNRNAGRQNMNQAFNVGNGPEATSRTKKLISFSIILMEDDTLEEIIELAVIMMARIQPADDNAMTEPNYDAKAISEVNASHKVHEQANHVKRKTIIHTSDDD
ncbi:hypothetical protein Tco_0522058 [Tanacetum coccineum]